MNDELKKQLFDELIIAKNNDQIEIVKNFQSKLEIVMHKGVTANQLQALCDRFKGVYGLETNHRTHHIGGKARYSLWFDIEYKDFTDYIGTLWRGSKEPVFLGTSSKRVSRKYIK